MITFKGKLTRRDYEEIGRNAIILSQKTQEYKHHLKILSSDTYRKFKIMKEDYDSGFIDGAVYIGFLKELNYFFKNNPEPYNEDLNAEEMLKEIKRFIN